MWDSYLGKAHVIVQKHRLVYDLNSVEKIGLIGFSETMVHRKTSEPGPQPSKKVALAFLNVDHGSKLLDYKPDNLVRLGVTLTSGAPGTWSHPGN